MIKNFEEFKQQLNESVSVTDDKLEWETGVVGTETPADGVYEANICGCRLTIDGKDYKLKSGPKAHFFGPFRVENGDVYMMPGTKQGFGNDCGEIHIKDPERGDRITSIKCVDSNGYWSWKNEMETF